MIRNIEPQDEGRAKEKTVEAKLRQLLSALETDAASQAAAVERLADKITGICGAEAQVERAKQYPNDLNTLVNDVMEEFKRNYERIWKALERAHGSLGEFEPPIPQATETPRRC